MTELATIELVVTDQGHDDGDDLTHIFCKCAKPDIALCGAELRGELVEIVDEELCVVCLDLNDLPCPRCGI